MGKLPDPFYDKFFSYWTERNELKGSSKMRFEHEKAFEIGRRVATFWSYTKDEERQSMWKEHNLNNKPNQLNFGNLLNANNGNNQ